MAASASLDERAIWMRGVRLGRLGHGDGGHGAGSIGRRACATCESRLTPATPISR